MEKSIPAVNARPEGPGPGAYSHSSHVGKEAPSFTLSGRPSHKEPAEVPGPGAYALKGEIGNAPAWSLLGRHDNKGPG